MTQFWLSLLFFLVALGLLWGVLHWVRYKKRSDTCSCGTGACLTGSRPAREHRDGPPPEKSECNPGSCHCDE